MRKKVSALHRVIPTTLWQRPWPLSAALPPKVEPGFLIEEERTPQYRPDRFYPAKLGDIFHSRYQLVTKLGYGSNSTVWLARDIERYKWQRDRYVALKINATQSNGPKDPTQNELCILKKIQSASSKHKGWHFVRKMVDHFTLRGENRSEHLCFVFDPLQEPLWLYCRRFVNNVIPDDVLKIILCQVLLGLDFLHTECHVIHTDLKPDNILVKPENMLIFEREALKEYQQPLPQKHNDHGRVIYLSRNNYGEPSGPIGIVQITDFGLSVSGDTSNHGCIQAELYRAPEVILDAGYSYPADVWSIGVMLWDLLQGKALFDMVDPSQNNDQYEDNVHLAYITALLGPVPSSLREKGRRSSIFYNDRGVLKDPSPIPRDFSLDSSITCTSGEERELFIQFIKKMLTWDPERRSTARELLDDPWLHSDDER